MNSKMRKVCILVMSVFILSGCSIFKENKGCAVHIPVSAPGAPESIPADWVQVDDFERYNIDLKFQVFEKQYNGYSTSDKLFYDKENNKIIWYQSILTENDLSAIDYELVKENAEKITNEKAIKDYADVIVPVNGKATVVRAYSHAYTVENPEKEVIDLQTLEDVTDAVNYSKDIIGVPEDWDPKVVQSEDLLVYVRYFNGFETTDKLAYDLKREQYVRYRNDLEGVDLSCINYTTVAKNQGNMKHPVDDYYSYRDVITVIDNTPTVVRHYQYSKYGTLHYKVIDLQTLEDVTGKVDINQQLM